MRAPIKMWREREREIVLTEDINGSESGQDGVEAKPGRRDGRCRVFGNRNWVGRAPVVIVVCQSETDAIENAVDNVVWRSEIGELNKDECFRDIVREDRTLWREVKEEDELKDPKTGGS